jgi:hypothetical protein
MLQELKSKEGPGNTEAKIMNSYKDKDVNDEHQSFILYINNMFLWQTEELKEHN